MMKWPSLDILVYKLSYADLDAQNQSNAKREGSEAIKHFLIRCLAFYDIQHEHF